jgi:hypothetical protein
MRGRTDASAASLGPHRRMAIPEPAQRQRPCSMPPRLVLTQKRRAYGEDRLCYTASPCRSPGTPGRRFLASSNSGTENRQSSGRVRKLRPRLRSWRRRQFMASRRGDRDGRSLAAHKPQSRTLLVENLENPYEYLTVAPGRRCAPVAFELARVVAADSPDGPEVTVFGPEPGYVASPPDPCRATPNSGHRSTRTPPTSPYSRRCASHA